MEHNFYTVLLIVASVAPSEESGRVRKAIENVLGDCPHSIYAGSNQIKALATDPRCLNRIHDQFRDRHVRAAARRLLMANRAGDSTTVMVNRQAALGGTIALCGSEEESSLGPISLNITSHELDAVIDWLTAYPTE